MNGHITKTVQTDSLPLCKEKVSKLLDIKNKHVSIIIVTLETVPKPFE